MATGISGLYKGTRGAKAAARVKYEKEIKLLAKKWNIGVERAFETIMKRIDKGLPPLPPSIRFAGKQNCEVVSDLVNAPELSKEQLNNCVKADISEKVAGRHYDLEKPVNETIELIEQIMARSSLPRVQAYLICNAAKYILRAGVKTADWGADIAKAENYLHRTLNGKWNSGK